MSLKHLFSVDNIQGLCSGSIDFRCCGVFVTCTSFESTCSASHHRQARAQGRFGLFRMLYREREDPPIGRIPPRGDEPEETPREADRAVRACFGISLSITLFDLAAYLPSATFS